MFYSGGAEARSQGLTEASRCRASMQAGLGVKGRKSEAQLHELTTSSRAVGEMGTLLTLRSCWF